MKITKWNYNNYSKEILTALRYLLKLHRNEVVRRAFYSKGYALGSSSSMLAIQVKCAFSYYLITIRSYLCFFSQSTALGSQKLMWLSQWYTAICLNICILSDMCWHTSRRWIQGLVWRVLTNLLLPSVNHSF